MSPSRSLVLLSLSTLLACSSPTGAPPAGSGQAPAPTPEARPTPEAKPTPAAESTPSRPQPTVVAATAGDPLAPLVPVVAHLAQGVAAFLAGGDLPTAFAPWPIHDHDAAGADPIRADIKAAGAIVARHSVLEFELVFADQGRDVFHLRTTLFGAPRQVRFVAMAGEAPHDGKVGVASHPLADFTGPAQPFRDAAEALVPVLRGEGCKELAFVAPAELTRLITVEAARKPLVDDLERSRQNLPALCDKLAALRYDQVRLRLDDLSLLLYGDDGLSRGALKCDFEVKPGQGFELGVKGFRPM